ncbi:hypothetical protein PMAYCL1PPCAC_00089 [Pristionchus mayeri]|uniref:Uncharacterized protein n=1 Tax=Pristionchus mayeri TaxID=1317129 RepID=A0AAN4YY04_9BILA|nr:hypothetical protein PMAYCL1PPCAC_00089 [Pristionchus mayeri]
MQCPYRLPVTISTHTVPPSATCGGESTGNGNDLSSVVLPPGVMPPALPPGLPGMGSDPFGLALAALPFDQLAASLNLQLQTQLQQQQQQAAVAQQLHEPHTLLQHSQQIQQPNVDSASQQQPLLSRLQALQKEHRPRPRASKEEYIGVACHICGAPADGMHYSAISCRSCNAFFRRAVSYEHKYVCRFGGNCEISVQLRCACRACRFRKCVEAGMRDKAVQPPRDPTGSQKEKKKKDGKRAPAQLNVASRELVRKQENRDGPDMVRFSDDEDDDEDLPSASDLQQKKPARRGSYNAPCKKSINFRSAGENGGAEVKMEMEDDYYDMIRRDGEDETSGLRAPENRSTLPVDRPWEVESVGSGYPKFERLVACYREHTRMMQLAMTGIEPFLAQAESGIKLREMVPGDVSLLSTTELNGLLFWIEKQDPYSKLHACDRRALFKRYSVRKLSLDHFYTASKWTEQCYKGNFVMLNNTFVPPDKTGFELETDDDKQRKAKAEILLPTFEQMWRCVIWPFSHMAVTDAEIVFLHALLLWSPLNNTHVRVETKELMRLQREWAIKMMFEHYRTIGQADPEVRFGEIVHLLAEIEVICDRHCQDFQVAKLFEFCDMSQFWYEKWCYSAPIRPDYSAAITADIAEMTQQEQNDPADNGIHYNVNTMQVPAGACMSPLYNEHDDTTDNMLDRDLQRSSHEEPKMDAYRGASFSVNNTGDNYTVPEKKAAYDCTPSAPSTTPSTPNEPSFP